MTSIQQEIRIKFNRFIRRRGWKGLLAVVFYPFITFVTTPVRLVQTLWNCRILADGRWGRYLGFCPRQGINHLFYWTQAVNLSNYGRNGISPTLGAGNFDLGKLWHLPLISNFAYWMIGSTVPLMGVFGWWAGHFMYINTTPIDKMWVIIIIYLTLISTTLYANINLQNYNALGWLFMPVGLFGWATNNWMISLLAWLGASFGSVTTVFLACILSITFSLQTLSIIPFLTVLPSGVKVLTHFWPFVKKGEFASFIIPILKTIGVFNKKAKYKRNLKLTFKYIYFLTLYIQFFCIYWIITDTFPWLLFTAIVLFVINKRFIRFSDIQSMYMLLLSVSTSTIILHGQFSVILMFSFWLMISPIPHFAGFTGLKAFTIVPVFKPFYITPVIEAMEGFLKPIKSGERCLIAFKDPDDDYGKIFDGYRALLEAPLYVASKKKVHFMPDWYGILDNNSENATDFCWGLNVNDVLKNMVKWQADYVVIYQQIETELENKWGNAGFKAVSHFSWSKFKDVFEECPPYRGATPNWWLLEYKKSKGAT